MKLFVEFFGILHFHFFLFEAGAQFLEEIWILQLLLAGQNFGILLFKLPQFALLFRLENDAAGDTSVRHA